MDLTKCFVKANKDNTELLAKHSQILTMSVFSKQRVATPENSRLIALTTKFLVYYKDETKTKVRRICEINFECRFEMLREVSKVKIILIQDPHTPGAIIGIKFQKSGSAPVDLFSSSPTSLQIWKEHLEKIMNQRGFHSLFKPIRKIGKGNFASVYLAERLEDKKLVAVKAFSKESLYSQEKGRQSLMNQIKLLRRLNQPNIMKLHCVYESNNSIYMTMELLDGGQLFTKIQSRYVFSSEQVKQIMRGLLLGLEHMHSKRIMHRDLKPENIILRSPNSCEPVIADFGLATWADEPQYLFVRCGTPGYVAPQIINIRDMKTKSDPICDVFSVGLIFHILLTGRSIFPGKIYNDVLVQNRACDFLLDSMQYQTLSKSSLSLLKSMLQKTPAKRIQASQALKHSYFTEMNIEKIFDTGMSIETPLRTHDENTRHSESGWSQKVSVYKEDSILKNITNLSKIGVSNGINALKQSPFVKYFPQHQKRYSNDINTYGNKMS